MRVGGVEETITVTGASPVVDIQNVRTQSVLTREVLDSVPTAKNYQAFAALTLGAVGSTAGATGGGDVGGSKGEQMTGSDDPRRRRRADDRRRHADQHGHATSGTTIATSSTSSACRKW